MSKRDSFGKNRTPKRLASYMGLESISWMDKVFADAFWHGNPKKLSGDGQALAMYYGLHNESGVGLDCKQLAVELGLTTASGAYSRMRNGYRRLRFCVKFGSYCTIEDDLECNKERHTWQFLDRVIKYDHRYVDFEHCLNYEFNSSVYRKMKKVLILYHNGKSYSEISKEMNMSVDDSIDMFRRGVVKLWGSTYGSKCPLKF